jgi:ParB family chromosome partitioning protein
MTKSLTPTANGPTVAPANRLIVSERNVRKIYKDRNIEAMAASIRKGGLLHNLVVTFDGTNFPVEAGERRRRAIQLLIDRGELPEDWPVRVLIIDPADSTSVSAIENMLREDMHPADQVEAFHELSREGWTIEEIADSFGVTPLVVERRLALAKAAPSLLDLLRKDEITTEQLIALCATDDHTRQETVWQSLPSYSRSAALLRRSVLSGEVDVSADPRVRFIGGPDAFIVAGGDVRRDLFSEGGRGGFISDVGLLEQLVGAKLETAADALRTEGWGWVDVWPTWDQTEYFRLGRIQKTGTALSPQAAERVLALRDEHVELSAEEQSLSERMEEGEEHGDEDEDRLARVYARMEEIAEEVAAIEAAHQAYDPAAMAAAGAVVAREGHTLRIERGLVRAADRKALAAALGGSKAIAGGRETEPAGRKPGELSDALTRSLFGHRNLAAQTATAGAPEAAKVLLGCWVVQTLRHPHGSHNVPIDLRISSEWGKGTRTNHPILDEGGEQRRDAFTAIGASLTEGLPKDECALWDALAEMPASVLDRLIAFGVASAVSLGREHTGLTAKLLTAVGFDMAGHFTPTAKNYLGRVSKAVIVSALDEAGKVGGEEQRSSLLALKKGELANRAEADLAGSGWVPAAIRTPKLQAVPGGKGTAAKKTRARSRSQRVQKAAA